MLPQKWSLRVFGFLFVVLALLAGGPVQAGPDGPMSLVGEITIVIEGLEVLCVVNEDGSLSAPDSTFVAPALLTPTFICWGRMRLERFVLCGIASARSRAGSWFPDRFVVRRRRLSMVI